MDPKTEPENSEPTFYNVMPKTSDGTLVTSTMEASEPSEPTPVAETPSITSENIVKQSSSRFSMPANGGGAPKWLKFSGLILGLVLIAAIAWFGYQYFNKDQQVAPANNTEAPVNQEPEQPEVTTPTEWLKKYFNAEQCNEIPVCGDAADPDRDGLTNIEEFNKTTDPNNNDSDADGLADGDEVNIFGSSPLTTRTNSSSEYTDADFARGGYDINTDQKFTPERLIEIKNKIKEKGLHQPTIKNMGAESLKQYDFSDPSLDSNSGDSSQLDSSIDQSPAAKLGRDTQRLTTIQKIGAGLLKYKASQGNYPETADFNEMVNLVKPFITVATNYLDPINKGQYVYGYVAADQGTGFTLMYFSETANQVNKYDSAKAELDEVKNNASVYDDQRQRDVETLAKALGIYSDAHVDPAMGTGKVFPMESNYKTELVPTYLTKIPVDPRTGKDYEYSVGPTFDTFTLRAVYDNPPKGTTGFMCNQDECRNY